MGLPSPAPQRAPTHAFPLIVGEQGINEVQAWIERLCGGEMKVASSLRVSRRFVDGPLLFLFRFLLAHLGHHNLQNPREPGTWPGR